jgi:transketolase
MMRHLVADPAAAEAYRSERDERRHMARPELAESLGRKATICRRDIIRTIAKAGMGHVGGDLSVIDILVTLYGAVLDVDPEKPDWAERDRLILSKGHCAAALYTVLARSGYFGLDELSTFMAPNSPLNGHPNRQKVPGVETNTGPLGHGLPVGVGCTLGAHLQGSPRRTFVIVGDGELQEGSNWEAAMAASQYRLSSLTVIVDRNGLQQGAGTEETVTLEPLAAKWAAFGFEVRHVDGHDHLAMVEAFQPARAGGPVAVIARTVKGRGVSFMENKVEWHHRVPTADQVEEALACLGS